ncbi:MAG: type II toxin-antitoxin system VapC family toxin [Thermoleophilia bacterium]
MTAESPASGASSEPGASVRPIAMETLSERAGPLLIDTSLWIEGLRRSGSSTARRIVAQAVEPGLALVNGLILVEILSGARDEGELRRLERLFEATTCLPLDRPIWSRAARLGFDLRRAGVSIPTVDLTIAACALEADVPLLHIDAHFELIAAHSELEQVFVTATPRSGPR